MNTAKCFPPDTTALYVAFKKEEDIIIDSRSKRVLRNGVEVFLTAKEYALLSLLYSDRGKVFSKAELLEKIWGITWDSGTNAVEVLISFTRCKVDKPFEKKLIKSHPGFGYSLIP